MPRPPIRIASTVKAVHFVLTGYGHWLPNDPRGSGSERVQSVSLRGLHPHHLGRRSHQPDRNTLREFYRDAEPELLHPIIWFRASHRAVIANAVEVVVRDQGYTLWALAVLRNHVHAVVRTHRDDSQTINANLVAAVRSKLHDAFELPKDHPIWSQRPHRVPLVTEAQIRGRIRYVELNPAKEGLPPQKWAFVSAFGK